MELGVDIAELNAVGLAQRAADPGQLCPAQRAGWTQRATCAGADLLHHRKPARPILLSPSPADGLGFGQSTAHRPRQRGAGAVTCACDLAGRVGALVGDIAQGAAGRRRRAAVVGAQASSGGFSGTTQRTPASGGTGPAGAGQPGRRNDGSRLVPGGLAGTGVGAGARPL